LAFWTSWFGTDMIPAALTPGYCPDAQRKPFADPGHPGLSQSLTGRGCNTLTGEFTIGEAAFVGGSVARFSADFEQHREGQTPALSGSLNYVDTSLAVPEPLTTGLLGAGLALGALLRARRR
jgi:hypothetical protein